MGGTHHAGGGTSRVGTAVDRPAYRSPRRRPDPYPQVAMMQEIAAPSASWPGFVPAIHVVPQAPKTWMPGTSPGMTEERLAQQHSLGVMGPGLRQAFAGTTRRRHPRCFP